MNIILRLFSGLLIFINFPLFSQATYDINDMPIIDGARYSDNASQYIYSSDWESFKSEYMGLYLYDKQFKAFFSDKLPHKVVEHYTKVLSVVRTKEPFAQMEINLMKHNSLSEVRFESNEFGAWFNWIYKVDNEELYRLFLTISSNAGFNNEDGKTIFHFTLKKYKKEVMVPIPGEDELQAPLYPNVTYVPDESIQGIILIHVFQTNDDLERVLEFYESNLNVKPIGRDDSYSFVNYKNNSSDFIIIEKANEKAFRIKYFLSPN